MTTVLLLTSGRRFVVSFRTETRCGGSSPFLRPCALPARVLVRGRDLRGGWPYNTFSIGEFSVRAP